MRRVGFHPEASAEAREARAWYERERPGLGLLFDDELARVIASLESDDVTWPLWPGVPEKLDVRRVLLHRFPFALAYIVLEDGNVIVVAVAHLKRRPGYWLKRVRGPGRRRGSRRGRSGKND